MRIEGNDLRLAAATATQMQNTGADKIVAPKPVQFQDTAKSKGSDTIQSIGGDKVSIQIEIPKKTVDTLQRMGNISDLLNSVATSIRQTSEGLKQASNIVEDMKTSLDNIIKNYPPFSLVNQERINQLMSYSSLKKQIISLMVPAPPTPVYEKVQHLWEDLFSGSNNTIQTPTLPLDVPDTHIKAAATQLNVISDQVGLLQDALGNSIKTG
jgi:archaellum component FlaC